MDGITIVTVNWHCADFIEKLLDNLVAKAANPRRLKALIIDNTNGGDRSLPRLSKHDLNCRIHNLDTGRLKGSRAHALALNHATKLLDTDFALITDPDIHVFVPDWDTFCIEQMNQNQAIAVGAPYPRWKVGKYHDFPSPPFCFFNVNAIRNLKTDWTPFSRTLAGFIGKFIVRQFGRIGPVITRRTYRNFSLIRNYSTAAEKKLGIFAPDTGWLIAAEARRRDLRSVLFTAVEQNETRLAPPSTASDWQLLAGHYELYYYNNKPVVTHKYGTGGWPWKTKHGPDEAVWRRCIDRIEKAIGEVK